MAIVRTLRTIKFGGSGQDAELTSVDLEYTDDASGAHATAAVSFSGTPSGAGSYQIKGITDEVFSFDQTDTLALIHERLADFINSFAGEWDATHSATEVSLVSKERGEGYNFSDLTTQFQTASGLSVTITPPSGGVQPTPIGCLNLMFDGNHSKLNMHSSYDSDVINDRAYFVGKMRSEISLPAPQETVETCDASGDVIETILFF